MHHPPTVLIIGIGPLRERFFAAAERRGVDTILVDETAYSRYDRLATENHAWRLTDHQDPGPDLHLLDSLAGRVDGVLALTDWGTRIAARLAKEWGLPGAGTAVADGLAHKADVRRRLAGTGAGLPFALTADADEAAELLRSAPSGAVIVKPVDGAASLGVRRVSDPAGLADAIAAVRNTTGQPQALVEHFVPGPEVSLEAVVSGGRVLFVGVTEKTCAAPPSFVETRHVIDPAAQERLAPSATRFVETVVTALDIDSAVLHLEAKHDGDRWHLIEAAFRPAGGLISDVLLRATGLDLYDAALSIALGDQDPARPRTERTPQVAAVEFVAATGTVADAPTMAGVRDGLPLVSHAERLLPPGTTLGAVDANWWRAGYVLGSGPDRGELLAQLSRANSRLLDLLGLTRVPDA
ncbi:ATP-grasp domain-containing protein [Streptomyces sp. SCA3-4]|uniref:ATP-grasp domain-containing protein n=1 Tax=Streptomyces sichuanensis TaxID=2871810 RepID=UPI001CE38388|nr:ATP-grasp domain-containing protein [Streptomyces sichuanensis]MCA6091314.1 ATP-grasp domain-containing protein [Streptomyces sichuanensis]